MGISYLHSFNMGDLLSILPGIKQVWTDSGKKGIVFQRLGHPGNYYQGATHPTIDDTGKMVCFNDRMLKMAKPLIEYQEYIEEFKEWEGEQIIVNFDKMRSECFVNIPIGEIKRWPFLCFPDMATDLSQKWLKVPNGVDLRTIDKLVVNRTERYTNPLINFFFLKEYEERAIFSGTRKEHQIFCEQWKLDLPYLEVNDFLELTIALKSSKGWLGNQTMQFQICEGLKIPRIVELCSFAPNVTPNGPDGYDFYHNGAVEYYVKKIMG